MDENEVEVPKPRKRRKEFHINDSVHVVFSKVNGDELLAFLGVIVGIELNEDGIRFYKVRCGRGDDTWYALVRAKQLEYAE
jgi:hypothetical protein